MSKKRKRPSMADPDELGALFEKAADAIDLFTENPDSLRAFVYSIKNGNISEARLSISASLELRSEQRRAIAASAAARAGERKE